tara:strand:- start:1937 stop:2374 length:438 start_codon:yes stop_codon:yes gene_type:complete
MARRTKLNTEIQALICQAIELGMTYKLSAQYAGISETTFHAWMSRGRDEETGIYNEFLKSVKKAESKGALANLAIIQKTAKEGNWQASAWILERRHNYTSRQEPLIEVQIDNSQISVNQLIEQIKIANETLNDILAVPIIDLEEE